MPAPHRRPVVLDTWPVIEHFEGTDPAASELGELLVRGRLRPVMSAATYAEVSYTLANRYGADAADHECRQLVRLVRIEPLDIRTANSAARLKHTYRMSLGDTFAAATAIRHGAVLWTGDPELLCPDRVWTVRDLRPPDERPPTPPGRRPSAEAQLDQAALAAYITAPFGRPRDRRRAGTSRIEE